MTKQDSTSGGDEKVSDTLAAAALRKIGASATPDAVDAYRTVGRWHAQQGVAEVALATTHQNDDALIQSLITAQSVMASNPDDVIKLKAISSVSQLVKARISNAELTLKCADALGQNKAQAPAAMNRPPQFFVQVNTPKS